MLWRQHAAGTFGGRVRFTPGDMLEVLRGVPDNTFESCVCDPPYHLTSIVKRFGADNAAPAKAGKTGVYQRASAGFMGKTWDGGDVAFRVETWAEVLRVLKPGAYIVAFSATRTYHRMACAIEDAGFITHPMFGWIFGSGFPKATRVEDDRWSGWRYGAQGTKPALEPVYFGQKPFSEKTGTANVLRWGCGAINVEACKTPGDEVSVARKRHGGGVEGNGTSYELPDSHGEITPGRWPANLIHDGSDEVVASFPDTGPSSDQPRNNGAFKSVAKGFEYPHVTGGHSDKGGSTARFFYAAKSSQAERAESKHPTVKPLALIRYLVRLVTQPGGLVLDPFAGSGTTGEASALEGMRAFLIDLDEETMGDLARRELRL
jgi:site-specific DNA-methyltransferase (adenine-specific)